MDTTHYVALHNRMLNEEKRLLEAIQGGKTQEIKLRSVWLQQIKKELKDEAERCDILDNPCDNLSDEDILKELLDL